MISRLFALIFFVPLVVCIPTSLFARPQYYLTDLGALGGPNGSSTAYGINSRGQVVGVGGAPTGSRAFLWTPSTLNSPFGSMVDLGDLPGGADYSLARGINSMGQVVGESSAATGTRAFQWTPTILNGSSGSMVDLGDLPGGFDHSRAGAINDSGQVAGDSSMTSGTHAFLWTPTAPNGTTGTITHLGDLPGGLDQSLGYDINAFGQVAGSSDAPPKGSHAFLWTPIKSNATTGVMVDLGDLPGSSFLSDAHAINGCGQVVGRGYPGSLPHAFLSTPSTANAETGAMIDLGDLRGGAGVSAAADINSQGWIVGGGNSTLVQTAFLWLPTTPNGATGVMIDLNSVLDPISAAGWVFQDATGINDSGQIVGYGRINSAGYTHALLLTPIPEPNALTIVILATIMLHAIRPSVTFRFMCWR